MSRQDTHHHEAAKNQGRDGSVYSADQHPRRNAPLDVMKRIAQRVGRGSASSRYDVARPAKPEPHRNLTRERPDRRRWNRIHAALLLVPAVIEPILLLSKFLRAAARSDQHSDRPELLARHPLGLDPGVRYGLARCRDGQGDGARHMLPFLWRHKNGFIEIRDFPGDLNLVTRSVEPRDAAYPALSPPGGVPEGFSSNPVRAHCAHPGHDHTAFDCRPRHPCSSLSLALLL